MGGRSIKADMEISILNVGTSKRDFVHYNKSRGAQWNTYRKKGDTPRTVNGVRKSGFFVQTLPFYSFIIFLKNEVHRFSKMALFSLAGPQRRRNDLQR